MCPKEHQQKAATQPARKREKKMSARHAEPRCLGPKPRLCGWKKSRPGRMCRSWGPKNLRRQSEISTGTLALTAQVRSERDHSEREHAGHFTTCVMRVSRLETPSQRLDSGVNRLDGCLLASLRTATARRP